MILLLFSDSLRSALKESIFSDIILCTKDAEISRIIAVRSFRRARDTHARLIHRPVHIIPKRTIIVTIVIELTAFYNILVLLDVN